MHATVVIKLPFNLYHTIIIYVCYHIKFYYTKFSPAYQNATYLEHRNSVNRVIHVLVVSNITGHDVC